MKKRQCIVCKKQKKEPLVRAVDQLEVFCHTGCLDALYKIASEKKRELEEDREKKSKSKT